MRTFQHDNGREFFFSVFASVNNTPSVYSSGWQEAVRREIISEAVNGSMNIAWFVFWMSSGNFLPYRHSFVCVEGGMKRVGVGLGVCGEGKLTFYMLHITSVLVNLVITKEKGYFFPPLICLRYFLWISLINSPSISTVWTWSLLTLSLIWQT